MPSIIIPAHNEEKVIRTTLTTLLAGLDLTDTEVLVICNGCNDGTAAEARSIGGPVQVIEIDQASKIEALNFGDSMARSYPRLYLDADVEIDGTSISQLVAELQRPGAAAAEPVPRIDTSQSSLPVKAYFAVFVALHGQSPGDVGSGMYAMSHDGRARFGTFPDVIADDAYARGHFGADELVRVNTATSVIYAPERLEDLLQIKTRSRLGTLELQQKYPELWAKKQAHTKSLIDKAAALPIRVWAAVPIYVLLQLLARRRARKLATSLDSYRWQRDESSRDRPHERRSTPVTSNPFHQDATAPPNMPSVSVTIVNTNAHDLVRECLQSLDRHPYTLGSMEIVVLDNASEDSSLEMLRDEFPGVIVLAEKVRRGFGANQNRAITAGTGQLAFILNPDAVVGAGTINALAEATWLDERVAAAGCPTLNEDGTARQDSPNPFPTPLSIYWKAFGLAKLLRRYRPVTDIFDSGWLSGGAMLVDRQTFLEIGGFDESFFIYSEDVDLCRRLRSSGYLFAWAPDASVEHPFPTESPEMVQRRQYEIVRSELSYMTKYYGTPGQYVYRVGATLDSAIRVLVLRLPGISRAVNVHGSTAAATRVLHRARLQAVLRPYGGKSIGDLAATWNSSRAQ